MSDCSSAAHFLQCSRPTLEDNLTFHLVRVKRLKYTKPPSVHSMPNHCRPQCSRRLRTSGKAWFVSVSPSWFAVTQGGKTSNFILCVCVFMGCMHTHMGVYVQRPKVDRSPSAISSATLCLYLYLLSQGLFSLNPEFISLARMPGP